MRNFDTAFVEQVHLNLKRYGLVKEFPPEMLETMTLVERRDLAGEAMLLELGAFLWGAEVRDEPDTFAKHTERKVKGDTRARVEMLYPQTFGGYVRWKFWMMVMRFLSRLVKDTNDSDSAYQLICDIRKKLDAIPRIERVVTHEHWTATINKHYDEIHHHHVRICPHQRTTKQELESGHKCVYFLAFKDEELRRA